jgi:citronellol/citronellal dehydrogenase
MAAAAHSILLRDSREHTGQFFVDEDVLAGDGVTDLDQYSVVSDAELLPDIFL